MQRLFRAGGVPPGYGYAEGGGPGSPHCGSNQRRQAGAEQVYEDIADTGGSGEVKPLASLIHRGKQQTKPQRPDKSPARPVFSMPAKGPEPEKVHPAVSQNVADFPEIEIDQIKLGRFQDHKPGQQPLEQVPGVGVRTHISR
jgi:hypothetical protein